MDLSLESYYPADENCSFESLDDNFPSLHFLTTFNLDSIHAILVSESWFKPSLPSTSFSLPGFILIRNDRTGKAGGGVCIYLRSHYPFKILRQSPSAYCSSPEYLFLEVRVNVGFKIVLGVVYSPPNINYFSTLESVLEELLTECTHLIVMGDFNTCLLKTDYRANKLRDLVNSLNLNLLPLSPTHHTSSSSSLLDLIFCSNTDLISKFGQFPAPAFSHHDLIFLSYRVKSPKTKPKIVLLRNFNNINKEDIITDVSKINWSMLEHMDSVDEMVSFFNREIIALFDRHAPLRKVKLKHGCVPWFNGDLKKAMGKRDHAFRRFKKERSAVNWSVYKAARNRCNQLCRNLKRRYFHENICATTDLSKFLRTMGIGKQLTPIQHTTLDINYLNSHFSSSSVIDPLIKSNTLTNIYSLPKPDIPLFTFSLVDVTDIQKHLRAITSKASGCSYPEEWRKAFILPLPKIHNPSLPTHYRPISILPFLSKIIESVVHRQLSSFLTIHDLFDPLQSGFRAGHSTSTALLKVTEDIREGMENKCVTVLVLIDFSNAFNAVDHDLLLALLTRYSISAPAIKWFSSYLRGRKQAIRTDEGTSDWCEVSAGVPQGGILSPLLFSLFINSITSYLKCQYHLYADDLQLYRQTNIGELHSTIRLINQDLMLIHSWSLNHGIAVNAAKCQAIIVGSPRQLALIRTNSLPNLIFDRYPIPFTTKVKDLGIIIDKSLSWSDQVNEISRKFYSTLHPLLHLKHFLPTKAKLHLVNTLLLPIIDYGDVCCSDFNQASLNKLDRLLNTCIRFVFGLRKYDHISQYRSELKWLPIRERRNSRILCLLFTLLFHPTTPPYLKCKFSFLSDSHERSLRSLNNLSLSTPIHRSGFMSDSFAVSAVRLWNTLPESIRRAPSRESFKRQVKEFFLAKI
ncbi:unnamed protein product [Euphydryas editha]|uniref:Reverse transcriptase domain-containing protein n=1 Tax=Euphydryas editha TaxID=104508 RepID=A0AAU9TD47_EUPED|nr:unnamed protein product [Euphydryas editha]